MASSINASTTAGVVTTADTSGVLNIQTAGTTAIAIDASQAVSFTNAPTVTGGTANGVAYLNGSKVLTTGSVLTFDGTILSSTRFAGALNGTVGATTVNSGAFSSVTATTTSTISVSATRTATQNVGNQIANFTSGTSAYGVNIFCSDGTSNGSASLGTLAVNSNTGTSRSINAAGTINASGADYAEYMTKAGNFTVAKGDVIGIDAQGKLTNLFADAISFVVKSTNPSYVGGDTWGSDDVIGKRPDVDATQAKKDAFETVLEVARQKVDRIAFAGQVPVNVLGATAGQYIIPVNDNGAIKGDAVSNPTFEQYQTAVGKVIAIESDGRAKIIVKVA